MDNRKPLSFILLAIEFLKQECSFCHWFVYGMQLLSLICLWYLKITSLSKLY